MKTRTGADDDTTMFGELCSLFAADLTEVGLGEQLLELSQRSFEHDRKHSRNERRAGRARPLRAQRPGAESQHAQGEVYRGARGFTASGLADLPGPEHQLWQMTANKEGPTPLWHRPFFKVCSQKT